MERTSRRVWPVIVAISVSVHPASASRVTAVPRRSLNVTPNIPARLHAFRHEVRKPSGVQGFPSVVVGIMVLRFTAASRVLLSGAPTGMTTRTLPFDCLSQCVSHRMLTMAAARDRLGAVQSKAQASGAGAGAPARTSETVLRHPPSRFFQPVSRDRGALPAHTD